MSVLLAAVVVLALSAVAVWRHCGRDTYAPPAGRHARPEATPQPAKRHARRATFTDQLERAA